MLSTSLGWPGLIAEPEQLLSLGLKQASRELALVCLFAEIQVSATQGEACACLGPPVPIQKSDPQNTSVLAKRGHGGLLTLGFGFLRQGLTM